MRRIVQILGFAGGALFFAAQARAATIHVPADYLTIYEALDAAQSGDVVEVAPGTYDQFDTRPAWFGDNVSAVGFLKDGVTLRSSAGPAATTLRLDSNTARPVILMGDSGELNISGFTFTGSLPDLIAIAVQPLEGQTTSLNVHNCIIRDFGMGDVATHELAVDASNVEVHIQDCSIESIDSPGFPTVYCTDGLLVEDTSFKNCSGGAMYVDYAGLELPSLTVKRSSFEDAHVYAGGTTLVEDSWFFQNQLSIGGNMVVRNNTFAGGYGIDAYGQIGEFTGNTFYNGTKAINFYGYGGGAQVRLERNIFSFSTSSNPAVEIAFDIGGSVVTDCNVFWQNAGGNTQGYSLGPTDLVADPQFCDAPAQDFTLFGSSPCLPVNSNGCGQIGAWGFGCGPVSIEPSSWGQIKALYRE
jgi:hypothetical protein